MKLFIERKTKISQMPKLKYEFIDLSSSGRIPKNLINNSYIGYNTVSINNDDKTKELFEIFQYLYDNGGVYIQNLNCSPDIFIKNNEMNVYNIHYFSCIKKSPIMRKMLHEMHMCELTMENMTNIFNKNTKNTFKFNKSLSFLM